MKSFVVQNENFNIAVVFELLEKFLMRSVALILTSSSAKVALVVDKHDEE